MESVRMGGDPAGISEGKCLCRQTMHDQAGLYGSINRIGYPFPSIMIEYSNQRPDADYVLKLFSFDLVFLLFFEPKKIYHFLKNILFSVVQR